MKDESTNDTPGLTRREVIKTASLASIAAAFPGGLWAAGASEKIRVGLIGCGGRGTGAAVDCATASPDVEIAALGDLFPDMLELSLKELNAKLPGRVKATPETCFTGFDAYKKVLATPVDLVILASPPFFRADAPRGGDRGRQARLHGEAGRGRPARRPLRDRHRGEGAGQEPRDRGGHAAAPPGRTTSS